MTKDIKIYGIPSHLPEGEVSVARSRIHRAVTELLEENEISEIDIVVSTKPADQLNLLNKDKYPKKTDDKTDKFSDIFSIEKRSLQYVSQNPLFSFEKLVLPKNLKDKLLVTIDSISLEDTLYEKWGLQDIQINPRTVLNFYGPPGTGKSLAAHAIAHRLGKKILVASYADIESKFHGDGPKNLKAIFYAAEQDKSLLFLDESDSLLSKRLTEVNSGSEQAINSMRSELLICLEQFYGVVIFATNLVENYDRAFETRMRHVRFCLPDFECRKEIWCRHFPEKLPLSDNSYRIAEKLAEIDNICGRDIRDAVIDAASRAALRSKNQGNLPSEGVLDLSDLRIAIEQIKLERIDKKTRNLSIESNSEVKEVVYKSIK